MDEEVNHAILARKVLGPAAYRHIYSHPVVLEKHRAYIKSHYPMAKEFPVEDMGLAAQELAHRKLELNSLVIAPEGAAQLYGLKILKKNLPANHGYFTRFVLVQRR
jgi:prephenate dehydratase